MSKNNKNIAEDGRRGWTLIAPNEKNGMVQLGIGTDKSRGLTFVPQKSAFGEGRRRKETLARTKTCLFLQQPLTRSPFLEHLDYVEKGNQ
jgi:hypothetical protein